MSAFSVETAIYSLPGIVLGLTVHECMHGWTANRCGDPTAKNEGRITLNPLKHIDPIGFLFLIFAGFGWAKPVMFNRGFLRNPRRDEALIAAAGPLSNLILAFVSIILFKITVMLAPSQPGLIFKFGAGIILYSAYINTGLFIFNMIPLPPLDGYHIVFQALKIPPATEMKLVKFGGIALFLLIIIDSQSKLDIFPIGPAVQFIVKGMMTLVGI